MGNHGEPRTPVNLVAALCLAMFLRREVATCPKMRTYGKEPET
jgi:hypothetical protein